MLQPNHYAELQVRRQQQETDHETHDEHSDPKSPAEPPRDDHDEDIRPQERSPAERQVVGKHKRQQPYEGKYLESQIASEQDRCSQGPRSAR